MKLPFKILKLTSIVSVFSLLFGLGACRDDLKVDAGSQDGDSNNYAEGAPYYMSFRFLQADGMPATRDDSTPATEGDRYFEDDSEKENQIVDMLFIFFNDEGEQMYCIEVSKSDMSDLPTSEGKEDIEFSFNTLSTISLPSKDPDKQKEIDKVESIDSFIAILNYDPGWVYLDSTKKKWFVKGSGETIPLTRKGVYEFTQNIDQTVSDKGFLMTNAGRYDENGKYFYYYQRAEKEQWFYDKRSDAKANPITIYMERVAARVDFKLIEKVGGVKAFYGPEQFGTDIYELYFHPTNWGITAKERNSFVPKHLKDNVSNQEYTKDKNYPFTETDPYAFYNWIHMTDYDYRVFWSESEHFFRSSEYYKYPETGAEPKTDDENLALNYLRYSDIDLEMMAAGSESKLNNIGKNDDGFNTYTGREYLLEHTFSLEEWKQAANPDAVPTSLIVYGYYTAKCIGNDKVDDKGNHKDPTTNNPGVELDLSKGFFIRDVGLERTDNEPHESEDPEDPDYVAPDFREIKYRIYLPGDNNRKGDLYNALLNEQYTIFIKKKDKYGKVIQGEYKAVKAEDGLDIFEIRNTYQYWNGATFVHAPNQYTLQLRDWHKYVLPIIEELDKEAEDLAKKEADKIKEQTGNEVKWQDLKEDFELYFGQFNDDKSLNHESMVVLSEANMEVANKMIQQTIWAAQYFDKSKGFFFGPIPHYLSKENFKSSIQYKKKTDNTYERDSNGVLILDHLTGDFGIVRNHIYNISVKSIKGLGYGKPEGDNIILPQPRPNQELYMFDMILEIIPWNKFEYEFDI